MRDLASQIVAVEDAENRLRGDSAEFVEPWVELPPGTYTVVAWNESTPLETRRLVVPESGGDFDVNFMLGRQ